MATSDSRYGFGSMPLTWPEVKNYFSRFEYFLMANKINTEDMKKATLLAHCGQEAFQMVVTVVSPKDIDDNSLTYDEIKKVLFSHLEPKVLRHYERFKFFNMKQNDEAIFNYLLALKEQSNRCQFNDMRDDLLLSQFICGLTNETVRNKLLTATSLTLEQAVQQALISEEVAKAKPSLDRELIQVVKRQKNQVQCRFCGRKHLFGRSHCPANGQKCNNCSKLGHFKAMCQSQSVKQTSKINKVDNADTLYASDSDGDIANLTCKVVSCRSINSSENKIFINVLINGGVHIKMLYDTGAQVTLITQDTHRRLQTPVYSSQSNLSAFNGSVISCIGVTKLNLYNNQADRTIIIDCFVVREGCDVLGLDAIEKFGFNPLSVNGLTIVNGQLAGEFKLKKDAILQGMHHSARPLPFDLRNRVEEEIRRQVQLNILEPVEEPYQLPMLTPIVVVPKADGRVRITGDYSLTLNRVLDCHSYAYPTINDIMHSLNGCTVFSVIDL